MPPPTECPSLSWNQPGPWASQAPPASGRGPALKGNRLRPLRASWNSSGAVPPGQSFADAGDSRTFPTSSRPPSGAWGGGGGEDCRGALAPPPPQARPPPPRPAPFAPPPPQPPARAGVPDPGPSLLLSLSPPSRRCHSGGSEDPGQSARSCFEPLLPQLNTPPRTAPFLPGPACCEGQCEGAGAGRRASSASAGGGAPGGPGRGSRVRVRARTSVRRDPPAAPR